MPKRTLPTLGALAALSVLLQTSPADACGGFFCGRQPVDQTAERILFEVGADSVTMTTQISFNGKAADFAWVLPLGAVPDASSLSVFSQRALNALDAGSGPLFLQPNDPACYQFFEFNTPGSANDESASAADSPVTVFIRAEVGEYDVAVIESDDPAALIEWLRTEGYRITKPMEPYIEQYTSEGLKFLALKLLDTADVQNLSPFRFTLPGTTPTIPLRMTALAAEPEMSIVAFVLGDQRFEGKNWANVEIADDQITHDPFSFQFPPPTNWTKLVAEGVDAAGGQGWVTEFAGASEIYAEPVRSQVQRGNFATPEDEEAASALLAVLEAHPYITRLYTRLSAEEMTVDPVLGRTDLGDVAREHQLQRIVNGEDMCSEERRGSSNPCDFATCGAAGLCRPVPVAEAGLTNVTPGGAIDGDVAACACLPGATARATFAPNGTDTTVICQDGRLSFLNPGDQDEASGDTLPDPCAGFSCGSNGQCVSMNMTPTCVCDQGFVAVGGIDPAGARVMNCVAPPELVPASFYQRALPPLPEALPGGRRVTITNPVPMQSTGENGEDPDVIPPASVDFPMPRFDPSVPGSDTFVQATPSRSSGGCSVGEGRTSGPGTGFAAALAALGLAALRRRRRS